MILVAVFQLFGSSNDYVGYKKIFTFSYGEKRNSTEPFFRFLRFLNDNYFNSSILTIFIFTSVFSFCLKWNAFKRITGKKSYFLFFCHTMCFFGILEYTQIRASCAIAIFLYSLNDLKNNKYRNYLLKAFIATLFHYSAFTMFIFYIYVRIFRSKKMYILLPVIGFFFSVICDEILGSELRNILYVLEKASGLNKSGNVSDFMSPFNTKYLLLLVTFAVNAVFTKENDSVNIILMKAVSFGLCFYYWLNPIGLPVISVRLAEFYTSVFVLYYFMNIRNFPLKEKKPLLVIPISMFLAYSAASIKTGIL